MDQLAIKHHHDAGHGWIEARRDDVEGWGIAEKLSGYSYQNGDKIFLEEDCDAAKYLEAVRAQGFDYTIVEVNDGDYSRIRSYQQY